METKKILILISALLIGLVLGFIFGQSITKQQTEQQIRQQVEAELQRLRGIVGEFWPTMPEIFSVSGIVKEVKDNSLLIEISYTHPLEELPTIREILVTENTKIIKRTGKDPEVHEREMEENMKLEEKLMPQIETGIDPEGWQIFPEAYLETEIALNQIETGSRIRAEANQDIKWAERFTAVKITVEF